MWRGEEGIITLESLLQMPFNLPIFLHHYLHFCSASKVHKRKNWRIILPQNTVSSRLQITEKMKKQTPNSIEPGMISYYSVTYSQRKLNPRTKYASEQMLWHPLPIFSDCEVWSRRVIDIFQHSPSILFQPPQGEVHHEKAGNPFWHIKPKHWLHMEANRRQ